MQALASDFDGTLFFGKEDPQIRTTDIEAIRRFQGSGGLFGICTGRSRVGIEMEVGDRIRMDFYILVSGALILDGEGRTIAKYTISRQTLRSLYEAYKGRVRQVIQGNDTVYSLTGYHPMQTIIRSLEEIPGDIYGMSFAAQTPEEAEVICREVNTCYAGELMGFVNINNIDIVPYGCSKGNALRLVKKYFGIGTMAGIGDSYNDLSSLEAADTAFTFPYAPDAVRQAADHVVASVAEALEFLQKAEGQKAEEA